MKIQGPRGRFSPGARREVERQGRQRVFQQQVAFPFITNLMLHEVQVIIGEEGGELGADEQCIPFANKVAANFHGFIFGLFVWFV